MRNAKPLLLHNLNALVLPKNRHGKQMGNRASRCPLAASRRPGPPKKLLGCSLGSEGSHDPTALHHAYWRSRSRLAVRSARAAGGEDIQDSWLTAGSFERSPAFAAFL